MARWENARGAIGIRLPYSMVKVMEEAAWPPLVVESEPSLLSARRLPPELRKKRREAGDIVRVRLGSGNSISRSME